MNSLTICIPTYKRIDYLYKLLGTIPESIPVCISDNGSFITNELDNYKNVQISHQKEVLGMFANWNKAIEMVKTKWFVIPGDDDLFPNDAFEQLDFYLDKYSDCGMIIFGHEMIDENDVCTSKWVPAEERRFQSPDGIKEFIPTIRARVPSIIFNTEKAIECGLFNPNFNFTAADSLLMQQLALRSPYAFVPRILGKYRVWSTSFTNQKCYSVEWFDQLYLWQDIISREIVSFKAPVDTKKMTSKIIYENIINGLSVMRSVNKTINERWSFVKHVRRECDFSFKDKCRIFLQIVK